MRFLNSVSLLALASIGLVNASNCKQPLVRKEWRTLSDQEKQSYISAVQCLKTKPAQLQSRYSGSHSRFDDFQAEHITQTDYIHFVGHFQPWHRMFVAQYESDLRELCGHNGAQPYWDWSQDTASVETFLASPIFDPITGFGGNGPFVDSSNVNVRLRVPGRTGGGCVQDGPFKSHIVSMHGSSTEYTPACLKRDFAPQLCIDKLNQAAVDRTMEASKFYEFDRRVQGAIDIEGLTYHGGGHVGIGAELGDISDIYSSPGDPLFFMHHANMDRIWDKWQRKAWSCRKKDIGGPDTGFAYPYDFFGANPSYKNVTLQYEMEFHGLVPGNSFVKIQEVMDTRGDKLCYTYQ